MKDADSFPAGERVRRQTSSAGKIKRETEESFFSRATLNVSK